ncbi:MAG TPA: nucleotidyl transferase AbiEii/AbiGii toxin family protein [Actinotalea sp.]|nr:nucleotidyl transferase AbiEii/AbiGii toxin family protein [Actinotalea sp.]
MTPEPLPPRPLPVLSNLTPKTRPPGSARILDGWVNQAQSQIGPSVDGGRLGWLIASTVVVAALQRAVDESGSSLFLLKGGTLLQHRLGLASRATKDVDGLIRGDLDAFVTALDRTLELPWGPLTLTRTVIETIATPARLIQPRRFDVLVALKGQTWRRVRVEISPDEAGAGAESEALVPPALHGFGLPEPERLVGLALRFQIAQKLHACSDPHDPPTALNDRARDVVDLLLLRELTASVGAPTLAELRDACEAVFAARAADARELGRAPRGWPCLVVAHSHWANDYTRAATSAGVATSLEDGIVSVNDWVHQIASSRQDPADHPEVLPQR